MATIRHEINIINSVVTGASDDLARVAIPAYAGDVTYYFEIVASIASGSENVSLRRGSTDIVTHSVNSATITRYRSSYTPYKGDVEEDYYVHCASTNAQVKAARVIIIQEVTTTPVAGFEHQFEIGNTETGKSNTTSAALTNPKYWYYDENAWDGGVQCIAEVVWSASGTMYGKTITLEEDNGSFASWATKVTIVNAATSASIDRIRSVAFTPVTGRNYRIAAFIENNMETYNIYSAKIIVLQSSANAIGSGFSISGAGVTAIAQLTTNRIAYLDSVIESLRAYDFDGSNWSLVGSGLTISGIGGIGMCSLSSTRVAIIDPTNGWLRAYDFDGSNWSLTGNSFALTNTSPKLCALSSSRIAMIDTTNDQLRAYDFNGTNWSLTGSGLTLTGFSASLAALSSSRVALLDDGNNGLLAYDFNGSTWSQTGNGTSFGFFSNYGICALSSTVVAIVMDQPAPHTDSLRLIFWEFDGTDWKKQMGEKILLQQGASGPVVCNLDTNRIAQFDSSVELLRAIDLYDIDVTKLEPQYLIANTGSFGGSTGLKDFDTLYDPAEWDYNV